MQYNYANALIHNDDDFNRETAFVRNYDDPREKIVNEQDQEIAVNAEDNRNEPDEALVAFEEGLKNDDVKVDEGKKTKTMPSTKNK